MIKYFETVDVFTEKRFCGNPLAVFTHAEGLTSAAMQSLAAEMNLSETTFVLPPENNQNTARVRIFNRSEEMPFAGHPMIGTAFVLARLGLATGDNIRFEVPAGIVVVEMEKDTDGKPVGGKITAPQPLSTGIEITAETVALCLGIDALDIVTDKHRPKIASVGNPYVIAELAKTAVARCSPNIGEFRRAVDKQPELNGRFSIHVYSREDNCIHARMFAPLAGTWEDPATGSANTPLGALLLSLSDKQEASYVVKQGIEIGRPSLLNVTAARTANGIIASVAGRCVPVFTGEIDFSEKN